MTRGVVTAAEAHDAELRRSGYLPAGRPQQLFRPLGGADAVLDAAADRRESVDLQRHPHLERAEAARELYATVEEVDLTAATEDIGQVLRMKRERCGERARVAYEENAALVRLEEPLVRIDRDRVRALDACEQRPSRIADHRRPAVGGVDVQ